MSDLVDFLDLAHGEVHHDDGRIVPSPARARSTRPRRSAGAWLALDVGLQLVGLLLPCNVVVRHTAGVTVVEAINPETLVTLTENPALAALAKELTAALNASLDILRGTA